MPLSHIPALNILMLSALSLYETNTDFYVK